VVAVRVGDEHGLDPRAPHGGEERREVGGIVGAGIDHKKAGLAEEIGIGAPMRHGRGVRGDHAAQARFELDRAAVVGAIHALFLSGPVAH
jgi:hypothetical protein